MANSFVGASCARVAVSLGLLAAARSPAHRRQAGLAL